MNISDKEFGRRFRKALSVPFMLKQVSSANVTEFVTSYSSALGCSEKSFFFPFLTCAAACMGSDCCIELSALWQEPPILWTLVVTPYSLLRIDVAEHLKQELLRVQDEACLINQEDNSESFKKFIFDLITTEQLHDLLKINNGHGLGIYNSIRTLHKCMVSPEDADVLHRLNNGFSWFKDSRQKRSTLMKTRVNLSIISAQPVVQQTLNTAPNFQELFYQCFLTVCAEETHVKFSQISSQLESEKLREIFHSIIKVHSSGPITYKLSAEANEKFGQIHDEITDKAKQMARKNLENRIFQPALSYLGRLSCILHVLDNIIESINYKVPLSPLTWNTEISAATVWHAREILGHIVEQRHALVEPTTILSTNVQKIQPIDLAGNQESSPRNVQTQPAVPNNSPRISPHVSPAAVHFSPNVRRGNTVTSGQNLVNNYRAPQIITARRNLMNHIGNQPASQTNNQFDLLRNQNNTAPVTPCISSVSSAGIVIRNKQIVNKNPNTSNNVGFNVPSALSVSYSADAQSSQPVLLSRTPHVSILDISNDDFIKSHKNSIKKVLIHGVNLISPSRCVQLKLIYDPTVSDDQQKYSLSFARTFLKKLEKMGFGFCEGQKNGNLRHFVFRKKKFSQLTDTQIKILSTLGINQRDYNKCFNLTPARKTAQNGGVVCLE